MVQLLLVSNYGSLAAYFGLLSFLFLLGRVRKHAELLRHLTSGLDPIYPIANVWVPLVPW